MQSFAILILSVPCICHFVFPCKDTDLYLNCAILAFAVKSVLKSATVTPLWILKLSHISAAVTPTIWLLHAFNLSLVFAFWLDEVCKVKPVLFCPWHKMSHL